MPGIVSPLKPSAPTSTTALTIVSWSGAPVGRVPCNQIVQPSAGEGALRPHPAKHSVCVCVCVCVC
eukprot:COSAG03_NODE_27188_length_254_cov_1.664516_1_plen_65_part_01